MDAFQFFSDHRQNQHIAKARAAADRAARSADRANDETGRLHERLDRLILVNRALWEVLRDHLGLDDDELMRRVEQVDARDGRLDGSVQSGTQPCPACARNVSRRRATCLYCGAPMPAV